MESLRQLFPQPSAAGWALTLGLVAFPPAPAVAQLGKAEATALPAATDDDHWWNGFGDFSKRGLNQPVRALTVYNGDVIAGGDFWLAGGGVQANSIARWDGTDWHPLGGGLDSEPLGGSYVPWVADMVVYNGDLIATGRFRYANGYVGGFRVNNIARWDGASWHALGSGLGSAVTDYGQHLLVYNGDLIATGNFTTAGGQAVNYIARWDGNSWHALGAGLDGPSYGLVAYHGDLIASGALTQGRVARWNGTDWSPMGTQEAEPFSDVAVYQDTLVVNFYQYLNGVQYRLVSQWNGNAWVPLGGGLQAEVGEIFKFQVYNERLYAGGFFLDPPGNHIARWNGTAWERLGSGVSGEPGSDIDGSVADLVVNNGSLYVGGGFLTAGNKPSRCIARWDDTITPVEVANLTAISASGGVQLHWELSRQAMRELRGVQVQRAQAPQGPYVTLTGLPLDPDLSMMFLDTTVQPGQRYWYRLAALSLEGNDEIVGPIVVTVMNPSPWQTRLYAPFEPSVEGSIEIRYSIGQSRAPVRLEIFDVTGRFLRSLEHGIHGPGEYAQLWNRRDDRGGRVARGVYLVHLVAGDAQASRKLVLAHE